MNFGVALGPILAGIFYFSLPTIILGETLPPASIQPVEGSFEKGDAEFCECSFSRFCLSHFPRKKIRKSNGEVLEKKSRFAEISKEIIQELPQSYLKLIQDIASGEKDALFSQQVFQNSDFYMTYYLYRHGGVLVIGIENLLLKYPSGRIMEPQDYPKKLDLRFSRIMFSIWKGLAERVEHDPSIRMVRIQGLNIVNPRLIATLRSLGFQGKKAIYQLDLFGIGLLFSWLFSAEELIRKGLYKVPATAANQLLKFSLLSRPGVKLVFGLTQFFIKQAVVGNNLRDLAAADYGSWTLQVRLPKE